MSIPLVPLKLEMFLINKGYLYAANIALHQVDDYNVNVNTPYQITFH